MNNDEFKKIVWKYYQEYGRIFRWRSDPSPYNVFVSEFMLQQTQTSRVQTKFDEFISQYPTIESLASAEWKDVLTSWIGLGYNRRAKNLHNSAQLIVNTYSSTIPSDKESLLSLPGIGEYTSSAIRSFAFNIPDAMIETNIRTVYLYHFFENQVSVKDKDILHLVEQTLSLTQPREWYWALMDYGVYLKSLFPTINSQSSHYKKQSKFKGSDRELRAKIIKKLTQQNNITKTTLYNEFDDVRVAKILSSLVKEGLIKYDSHCYSL